MDLDFKGLKCPQPTLKLAVAARQVKPGTTVKVTADCPSFPTDVKKWCEKAKKVLIACNDSGGRCCIATIQF